jgi:hypothetical protein
MLEVVFDVLLWMGILLSLAYAGLSTNDLNYVVSCRLMRHATHIFTRIVHIDMFLSGDSRLNQRERTQLAVGIWCSVSSAHDIVNAGS